ncbi:MAG: hypothetical protein JNL53_17300 [Cyclobacteriaceae bacterium]|nr:hypothetical protein [Cyclobacteriaceae bacterium]
MRVANIIIAHKNPKQLKELLDQFSPEYYHTWLHIDSRSNLNDFKELLNLTHVTILPRRRVVWAGFSFIRVTVEAMQIIKKENERFAYFNLMSGLDFPVKPTTEFHSHLMKAYHSNQSEFFHITELDENWPANHRYERYHLNDWTIKGRYFTERIINYFIPKREYFKGKLKPYGRSAWFTATDNFVDFCLKYFVENPDYLKFLETVWCPDELVFSSLIMGSPFKENLANNNLRYIDWSEGRANPKTLRMEDFEKVINSGNFLARKFDSSVDQEIIDKVIKTISI